MHSPHSVFRLSAVCLQNGHADPHSYHFRSRICHCLRLLNQPHRLHLRHRSSHRHRCCPDIYQYLPSLSLSKFVIYIISLLETSRMWCLTTPLPHLSHHRSGNNQVIRSPCLNILLGNDDHESLLWWHACSLWLRVLRRMHHSHLHVLCIRHWSEYHQLPRHRKNIPSDLPGGYSFKSLVNDVFIRC